MTTPRPDPLDEVLREAHLRGQVVLWVPTAGAVFVRRECFEFLDEPQEITPASARAKGSS